MLKPVSKGNSNKELSVELGIKIALGISNLQQFWKKLSQILLNYVLAQYLGVLKDAHFKTASKWRIRCVNP